MSLNLNEYKHFIDNNTILSPDLEEFSVFYWFANPPQGDSQAVQKITKRYPRLRKLQVGSCCHSTTDDGFKYFTENDEGIRAGLELESLFLVCTTQVRGRGWLEIDSVKKYLPKLKELKIGGGRVFCNCGARGCGECANVFTQLKSECGVQIEHSAPHW